MNSNMDIYDKVRKTPLEAQKTITGGRLNGFTDINPQYRIQCLTEQFGPVGFGWYYTIDKKWTEQAGDEIMAFVDISLFVKTDEWSKPIHGTGGSGFYVAERNGLRASDECYKMATTDAISVACKQLGIGADIYWAKGESKYNQPQEPVQGTKVEKASINKFVQDKSPAVVTQECAEEEYQRRRNIIASLMKTMKKTNADYTKDAHGFDMKIATTQEFTQFERDLSNKWLAS